jgi:hypothetical protein
MDIWIPFFWGCGKIIPSSVSYASNPSKCDVINESVKDDERKVGLCYHFYSAWFCYDIFEAQPLIHGDISATNFC